MAAPIGPGDWVEAIYDQRPYYAQGSVWEVDSVYQPGPNDVCGRDKDCRAAGLQLVGMTMPTDATGACACGFRPIWNGQKSLIETLLEPIAGSQPQRVCEPA